jgi:hypothetical protein
VEHPSNIPKDRIILYGDDLASCFCQRQLAPAFAATNTSMFEKYLIISTGNHFGGRWGPANNEPLARARSKICEWMHEHSSYQLPLNHDEIQQNFKVVLTKPTTPLAQARVDTPDQLTYDTSGTKYQIKHVMYIDDSQTAQIQRELDRLPLLIASSLESVYILLGYPGPIEKPHSTPSVAFDKIVEAALGALSTFLGLNINTDDLTMETPEHRLKKRLRDIINRHWNRKRKSFIARQAAQLIGNLVSCLQGCHWLKLLAFEFTRLLRESLSRNAHRLI